MFSVIKLVKLVAASYNNNNNYNYITVLHSDGKLDTINIQTLVAVD